MRNFLLFVLSLLSIKVSFVTPKSIIYPSPTPTLIPTPTIFQIPQYQTDISAPFIVQAPFNQWKDDRYQDACEEATSLMAVSWAKELALDKNFANQEIANLSAWQKTNYGEYRDTSARDTLLRIIHGYYQYKHATFSVNVSLNEIVKYLYEGKLVIAPMNGQALNNPYFTQPGPERHMVLIRGYDPVKREFITNDPGIGKGEGYRYPQDVFYSAIRDYFTGYHLPIHESNKNIIIVSKAND